MTGKDCPKKISINSLTNSTVQEKHNRAGGLGLGLSISKGIIELHGGRITAGNKKPSGARFIIYLPVETKEKKEQT